MNDNDILDYDHTQADTEPAEALKTTRHSIAYISLMISIGMLISKLLGLTKEGIDYYYAELLGNAIGLIAVSYTHLTLPTTPYV